MKLSYLLLLMIVISATPLVSLSLPSQAPSTTLVNQINAGQYPTQLTYVIKYNISNKTQTFNLTYTVNVETQGNANVSVATNAEKLVNGSVQYVFSFLKNGTYQVNLIEDPMKLTFLPYIYPGFLYNSTYGVSTPEGAVALNFLGELNYTLFGQSVYKYNIYMDNGLFGSSIILGDGVLYQFNTTYKGGSLSLQLTDQVLGSSPILLQSNVSPSSVMNLPYIYSTYNFSDVSQSLLPSGYVEYMPSTLFGNGIMTVEQAYVQYVELEPVTKAYVPVTSQGLPVSFLLEVGNESNLTLPFVPKFSNTEQIQYQQMIFKLNGTSDGLYQYVNRSGVTLTELEIEGNGTIYQFSLYTQGGNHTYIPQYRATLVGNRFVNGTVPPIVSSSSGNLPFKVISPMTSLLITIIVTVVISAIIVLLHRPK